jgi:SAM-dependent methyltransferase
MSEEGELQATYDRVADEYARRIFHELDGKPFDRDLLDRFADRLRGRGPVYDLGCGPGHVARYLHERGVQVTGIDLSGAMVQRARALSPGIDFRQGDLRALDVPRGGLAAIVAFYSIVHLGPETLPEVFREWHRALAPGAPVLLAFHLGSDTIHLEEWWGHPVSVDFVFFESAAVVLQLQAAGFRIVQAQEREPYPEVEHPSRRAYILAEAA